MKKFLFSLLLAPALMATGRHTGTKVQTLTSVQTFITAAQNGDFPTIQRLANNPEISRRILDEALIKAYTHNTAKPTDTWTSPYTLIIELLLDKGALPNTRHHTKQSQSR